MNEVEMTEYIGECLNYKRGWRGIKAMIGCKYVAPKKSFDMPVKSNNIGCQFDFKLNRRYNTCQVIYDRESDSFIMVLCKFVPGKLNTRTFTMTEDKWTNVKVIEDVYFDELRSCFESNTGLYLNL